MLNTKAEKNIHSQNMYIPYLNSGGSRNFKTGGGAVPAR